MPIPGQGVVPTGDLYLELTATTRRAFVPRLFVQMYFATPTWFYLMGGAQRAAGGLSQITVPIQGQSMVQGQFTGYSGGFNAPVVTPGITNAQFPLAYWVVPIPLPFGETVLQATDREISILKARMNDAYAVSVQNLAPLTFTNNTGNPLLPNSFLDGFDDGTNFPVYGGISRNAPMTRSWAGQFYNSTNITTGWTRKTMSNMVIRITDAAGGEAPTFGVMNPSDFSILNDDFIGVEQIFTRPGLQYAMDTPVRTSFPNLNVAGVPIYSDHHCPLGNMFFVNTKYTNLYLSEDAAFDFSGFFSLVPLNQIGQQGVVVLGYNIITAKPSANAWITGFSGGAW